jgi:uncharacterized membrane-anchored protein YjiN (DUF445 family)
MRGLATGLLALMALVFVGASLAPSRYAAAPFVRAFAEAALVGACADWFAVTALFRRPLGLPIPHTAIVPRNKDRIGETLGRFIVDNFLSPSIIDAKLKALEIGAWGSAWLTKPANAALVARRLVAWTPEILSAVPESGLDDLIGRIAIIGAKAVPASDLLARLIGAYWRDDHGQPLVAWLAGRLRQLLLENQDEILRQIQTKSWQWVPKWVDRIIAQRITDGLVQLLEEVIDPDHPLRAGLDHEVARLVERLTSDEVLQSRVEDLKMRLLDDPEARAKANAIWRALSARLTHATKDDARKTEAFITPLILRLGGWLADDKAVLASLNGLARVIARRLIAPRRVQIGQFVAQIVASWDTAEVVDRLEVQVGADLQFIRINGTIVGGVVGLTLYGLARIAGLAPAG